MIIQISVNLPNILKFVMYFGIEYRGIFIGQAGDIAITRRHHSFVTSLPELLGH